MLQTVQATVTVSDLNRLDVNSGHFKLTGEQPVTIKLIL